MRAKRLIPLLVIAGAWLPAGVQAAWWQEGTAPVGERDKQALVERWLQVDEANLRQLLSQPRKSDQGWLIELPTPYGGSKRFLLRDSGTLPPELAARYPQIRSYAGVGIDDPLDRLRLDLGPDGVGAMLFADEGVAVLQSAGKRGLYRVYQRETVTTRSGLSCGFAPSRTDIARPAARGRAKAVGSSLRVYRTAIAATGEYTAYFGGSTAQGLAGVVAAVNRVNQVLENEAGLRLQLVANNDAVVYTSGAADPYTNEDGGLLLDENQANLDAVIGSANYDLGHVFSTGGGGIAQLYSPCSAANKAKGVTGSSQPDQDPFWIDYVAHEVGHQLGAFHTFNDGATDACSGNRDQSTAFEPGSGSTILSYAGICGPLGAFSLQSNSDPYFHAGSLGQIHEFLQDPSGGASCGSTVATGNTAPSIVQTLPQSGGADSVDAVIPARTPFLLDAQVTDQEGDILSYTWEQMDTGTASPPMDDDGSRAIIRSYSPTSSAARSVPRLSDLRAGTQTFGESLPTTSRTLRFRLTARDNRAGGGGVSLSGEPGQASDVLLQVVDTGQPFRVTSHASTTTLGVGSSVAITWDVASTTAAPVACAQVAIGWSADGGLGFGSETLAANSGSAMVTVPNLVGTQTRIRVRCSSSPFFDINDADLVISGTPPSADTVFSDGFEG